MSHRKQFWWSDLHLWSILGSSISFLKNVSSLDRGREHGEVSKVFLSCKLLSIHIADLYDLMAQFLYPEEGFWDVSCNFKDWDVWLLLGLALMFLTAYSQANSFSPGSTSELAMLVNGCIYCDDFSLWIRQKIYCLNPFLDMYESKLMEFACQTPGNLRLR